MRSLVADNSCRKAWFDSSKSHFSEFNVCTHDSMWLSLLFDSLLTRGAAGGERSVSSDLVCGVTIIVENSLLQKEGVWVLGWEVGTGDLSRLGGSSLGRTGLLNRFDD